MTSVVWSFSVVSIYMRVSKKGICLFEVSCSNLIEECLVLMSLKNLFSLSSLPV